MTTQTTKYLDECGTEILKDELLPDLSNVFSIVRTEEMTKEEIKRKFGDDAGI